MHVIGGVLPADLVVASLERRSAKEELEQARRSVGQLDAWADQLVREVGAIRGRLIPSMEHRVFALAYDRD